MLPISLADLPIMPGYFRREASVDVRRCPDAAANCPIGHSVCPQSTSGCQGGRDHASLCRPGLTGIFCRACVPNETETRFYLSAADGRNASCAPCAKAVERGLSYDNVAFPLVLASTFAAVLLVLRVLLLLPRFDWLSQVLRSYTLALKLKIIVGFFMIAVKFETVYEVYLPDEVRVILEQLRITISFGVEGVPLSCLQVSCAPSQLACLHTLHAMASYSLPIAFRL